MAVTEEVEVKFCSDGHDWTWVEAWEGEPAYYYCAVCAHVEIDPNG